MVNTGIKTYHTSKIAGLSTRFQNKSDVCKDCTSRKFKIGKLGSLELAGWKTLL